MFRTKHLTLALPLLALAAGALMGGCKSRDEIYLEKLHSPFEMDHDEAIYYFGTEKGVESLTVLKEEMTKAETRVDMRKICENMGAAAIDPLIQIINEDVTASPYPYTAEDLFLNAPQDGIEFGDHAGLIRAGTACECLWSLVEAPEDVDKMIDLYLAKPAVPERAYVYLVLRDLHEKSWNGMAERVKRGASAEHSHQMIRFLTTPMISQDMRSVDALSGDIPAEGLEALLQYSDVPTRMFYLNAMAYEHNDALVGPAMELFKKEAKENPDDPLPPLCVGALMVIQNMGVDRDRQIERWLDKSRETFFANKEKLGWTTYDQVLYMEQTSHYYSGIMAWYYQVVQDQDMLDKLAEHQRALLHPADDIKASVKPRAVFKKEKGETPKEGEAGAGI